MTLTHAGRRSIDVALQLAVALMAFALTLYSGLKILADLRR